LELINGFKIVMLIENLKKNRIYKLKEISFPSISIIPIVIISLSGKMGLFFEIN
jgi:hypothetical protein